MQEVFGSGVYSHEDDTLKDSFDIARPYLSNVRHIYRLRDSLMLSYPNIKDEVFYFDYLLLEVFKLFEPKLYRRISVTRELVGHIKVSGEDIAKEHFESKNWQAEKFNAAKTRMQEAITPNNKEHAERIIAKLFPIWEVNFTIPINVDKRAHHLRRISAPAAFDHYFTLLPDKALVSKKDVFHLKRILDDEHSTIPKVVDLLDKLAKRNPFHFFQAIHG